jgi:hypothetical protein
MSLHDENCCLITSSQKCAIWFVRQIRPLRGLKHLPDGVAQEKNPAARGEPESGEFGWRPEADDVLGF